MSSDAPRVHGGLVAAELAALGVAADEVLDFSVNVNPYGPSAGMRQAVRSTAIDRYPDPTARPARVAIAATIGASPDEIVVGNGAADLLFAAMRALLAPEDVAVIVAPTFGEASAAVTAARGRVAAWRAEEETGFAIDLEAVAALARRARSRVIYLCNPNNPTGVAVPAGHVAAFAAAMPDATIVLDQAFLSLSDHHADEAMPLPANVVRLRSLTKDHAVPGVRVGYLATSPPLAMRIEACRPAWSASAPAIAAAVAAVGDAERHFVAASRAQLLADRARLAGVLRELGLRPLPSATTFLLVADLDAAALRRRLLVRHRILVRDAASFGLPRHVRLAARPAADVARLGVALRAETGPVAQGGSPGPLRGAQGGSPGPLRGAQGGSPGPLRGAQGGSPGPLPGAQGGSQ